MFYYVGSKLAFQWTAQHGCGGNENTRCEVGAHVYARIRPLIVVRVTLQIWANLTSVPHPNLLPAPICRPAQAFCSAAHSFRFCRVLSVFALWQIVLQYMCNDPTGNPNLRDGTPDDVQVSRSMGGAQPDAWRACTQRATRLSCSSAVRTTCARYAAALCGRRAHDTISFH